MTRGTVPASAVESAFSARDPSSPVAWGNRPIHQRHRLSAARVRGLVYTREYVEENVAEVSFGTFNTQRYLTLLSPTKGAVRSFVALEGYLSDGPYDNRNNYHRFNGLAKLTMNPTPDSELTLTGSYYKGDSNASGQIPLRAVEQGIIDNFGSIDPSEGGNTQRATGRVRFRRDARPGGTAFANIYAQYYELHLFSNFTFFLKDPVNGDGIEQNDN